jgi:hypothetical protein
MNKDAEAVKNILVWLSREPSQFAAPSGKRDRQKIEWEGLGAVGLQPALDPLDSEPVAIRLTYLKESGYFPVEEFSFFEPGEIPAVQDRFHSLLKRRIQTETELKPPVFPWETEGYEYDAELVSTPDRVPAGVPAGVPAWAAQLQSLNLPVPMPEKVLAHLFSQCQAVMQSSLQEGAKLVRAVESLFPGQDAALNQLAGFVLASPVRSGAIAPPMKNAPGASSFPINYDVATAPQQMALSLIAAREIIESLTLKVSPQQSVQRQWQMAAGMLNLVAEYDAATDLKGQGAEARATRSDAGSFSLELYDLEPNRSCLLDVQMSDREQPSVIFSVCPVM